MIKRLGILINRILDNDFRHTIIFMLFLFLMDYFNIFGVFNLDFSNINVGMWNVVIIFVVFYLSYVYIDSKNSNLEKEHIKQKNERIEREKDVHQKISYTKDLLLNQTYLLCLGVIEHIDSDYFLKTTIPKIDFNKKSSKDETFSYLLNTPFVNDDKIMELSLKGYLSKDELEKYMYIKLQFKSYVFKAVAAFDHKEISEEMKQELKELLVREVQE